MLGKLILNYYKAYIIANNERLKSYSDKRCHFLTKDAKGHIVKEIFLLNKKKHFVKKLFMVKRMKSYSLIKRVNDNTTKENLFVKQEKHK